VGDGKATLSGAGAPKKGRKKGKGGGGGPIWDKKKKKNRPPKKTGILQPKELRIGPKKKIFFSQSRVSPKFLGPRGQQTGFFSINPTIFSGWGEKRRGEPQRGGGGGLQTHHRGKVSGAGCLLGRDHSMIPNGDNFFFQNTGGGGGGRGRGAGEPFFLGALFSKLGGLGEKRLGEKHRRVCKKSHPKVFFKNTDEKRGLEGGHFMGG